MEDESSLESHEDVFEVEKILDTKLLDNNLRIYKVKWKGYGSDDDTWEPDDNLLSCQNMLKEFWNDRKLAARSLKARKKKKKSLQMVAEGVSKASFTFAAENIPEPNLEGLDCSSKDGISKNKEGYNLQEKSPLLIQEEENALKVKGSIELLQESSSVKKNRLTPEKWDAIKKAVTQSSSREEQPDGRKIHQQFTPASRESEASTETHISHLSLQSSSSSPKMPVAAIAVTSTGSRETVSKIKEIEKLNSLKHGMSANTCKETKTGKVEEKSNEKQEINQHDVKLKTNNEKEVRFDTKCGYAVQKHAKEEFGKIGQNDSAVKESNDLEKVCYMKSSDADIEKCAGSLFADQIMKKEAIRNESKDSRVKNMSDTNVKAEPEKYKEKGNQDKYSSSLSFISFHSSSSSDSDDKSDSEEDIEAKSLLAKWGAKKYLGFTPPSKEKSRKEKSSMKKKDSRKKISFVETKKSEIRNKTPSKEIKSKIDEKSKAAPANSQAKFSDEGIKKSKITDKRPGDQISKLKSDGKLKASPGSSPARLSDEGIRKSEVTDKKPRDQISKLKNDGNLKASPGNSPARPSDEGIKKSEITDKRPRDQISKLKNDGNLKSSPGNSPTRLSDEGIRKSEMLERRPRDEFKRLKSDGNLKASPGNSPAKLSDEGIKKSEITDKRPGDQISKLKSEGKLKASPGNSPAKLSDEGIKKSEITDKRPGDQISKLKSEGKLKTSPGKSPARPSDEGIKKSEITDKRPRDQINKLKNDGNLKASPGNSPARPSDEGIKKSEITDKRPRDQISKLKNDGNLKASPGSSPARPSDEGIKKSEITDKRQRDQISKLKNDGNLKSSPGSSPTRLSDEGIRKSEMPEKRPRDEFKRLKSDGNLKASPGSSPARPSDEGIKKSEVADNRPRDEIRKDHNKEIKSNKIEEHNIAIDQVTKAKEIKVEKVANSVSKSTVKPAPMPTTISKSTSSSIDSITDIIQQDIREREQSISPSKNKASVVRNPEIKSIAHGKSPEKSATKDEKHFSKKNTEVVENTFAQVYEHKKLNLGQKISVHEIKSDSKSDKQPSTPITKILPKATILKELAGISSLLSGGSGKVLGKNLMQGLQKIEKDVKPREVKLMLRAENKTKFEEQEKLKQKTTVEGTLPTLETLKDERKDKILHAEKEGDTASKLLDNKRDSSECEAEKSETFTKDEKKPSSRGLCSKLGRVSDIQSDFIGVLDEFEGPKAKQRSDSVNTQAEPNTESNASSRSLKKDEIMEKESCNKPNVPVKSEAPLADSLGDIGKNMKSCTSNKVETVGIEKLEDHSLNFDRVAKDNTAFSKATSRQKKEHKEEVRVQSQVGGQIELKSLGQMEKDFHKNSSKTFSVSSKQDSPDEVNISPEDHTQSPKIDPKNLAKNKNSTVESSTQGSTTSKVCPGEDSSITEDSSKLLDGQKNRNTKAQNSTKEKTKKLDKSDGNGNIRTKNTAIADSSLRLEFTKVKTASVDQSMKPKNSNKRSIDPKESAENKAVKKIKIDAKSKYAYKRQSSKEAFASPTKDVLGDILGRSEMLRSIDKKVEKKEELKDKQGSRDERLSDKENSDKQSRSDSTGDFDIEEFYDDNGLFLTEEDSGYMDSISVDDVNPREMSQEEYMKAFCIGDYSTLLDGIANGMDPDCWESSTGRTPLWSAIEDNRYDIAKKLLKLGSNPNYKAENGKTALMLAVEEGKFGFVNMLLQAGAHVNLQQHNGETALILACRKAHEDIINLLLSHGADVKVTPAHNPKPVAEYSPEYHVLLIKRIIDKYTEKLKVTAESVIKQCLNSTDEIVQPPVLTCRCISPEEKKIHEIYFECEHNGEERGTTMLLLCACVKFTPCGEIRILLDKNENGIEAVILNKEHQIPVFEKNHSMYFLFPSMGYVNTLCLRTRKSGYKLLVAIYTIRSDKSWIDDSLEDFYREIASQSAN